MTENHGSQSSKEIALAEWLSPERLAEVDEWIAKYPAEQRQSAVMRTLMLVQEQQGEQLGQHYLPESLMQAVARYLQMPDIAVYEVATFYSLYHLSPTGKHTINVCRSFACKLRGSDEIVQCFKDKLKISTGDTTEDKQFTLREVECLGACVGAPVAQIDKQYHESLTPECLDKLLERYSE